MDMSTDPFTQRHLCLITDPAIPDLVPRVVKALDAGITMLQVRGHALTAAQLFDLACEIQPLCHRYGVLCLINDRLDIGLVVHADGFQLGRHSIPLATARQLVGPDALLGASVHSLHEAQFSVQQGADFLLAGTIFSSASHPGEPTSGLALLRDLKREYPTCPVLAIGGITPGNVECVVDAGADGVAVISAILQTPDIAKAVKNFRLALGLP
jgi:thiamine-phosphate pyrophosphorylase